MHVTSLHRSQPIAESGLLPLDRLRQKHRLMYIDLRMLCLIKECLLKKASARNPHLIEKELQDDSLSQAASLYKALEQMLDNRALEADVFSRIDQTLDKQIEKLQQERTELMRKTAFLILFKQLFSYFLLVKFSNQSVC